MSFFVHSRRIDFLSHSADDSRGEACAALLWRRERERERLEEKAQRRNNAEEKDI